MTGKTTKVQWEGDNIPPKKSSHLGVNGKDEIEIGSGNCHDIHGKCELYNTMLAAKVKLLKT